MPWFNPTLDPAELPPVDALTWRPMAASYPWIVLMSSMVSWLIVLFIVFFAAAVLPQAIPEDQMPPLLAWLLPHSGWLLLFALYSLLKGQVTVRTMRYCVRDQDIHFRRGLVWRRFSHLPISRIQHVSLASGPLERAFGVQQLMLFTAGSGGADMVLPGLPRDSAEQLRQFIIDRAALDEQ